MAALREFFRSEPIRKTFPNFQEFDLPSLKGRLLSSSYVPESGQPGHEQMLAAIERLGEAVLGLEKLDDVKTLVALFPRAR